MKMQVPYVHAVTALVVVMTIPLQAATRAWKDQGSDWETADNSIFVLTE